MTMIRVPYIQHYWTPTDNLDYWTGYIVLLSNLESAIGCIASSVPAFYKFGRWTKAPNSNKARSPQAPGGQKSLITIGSLPVRNYSAARMFRNPTDQGVSFASVQAGNWNRLPDGTDSSADIREEEDTEFDGIRAEYTYEVELTQLKEQ